MLPTNSFYCQKCSKSINLINQTFHQMTCQGSDQKSDAQVDFQPIFKKPDFREEYPKVNSKYKKEIVEVDPRYAHGYKCPKCTSFVQEKEFRQHVNSCPYQACPFCFDYYPLQIAEEHTKFCDKRFDQHEDESNSDIYQDYEHENDQGQYQTPTSIRRSQNQNAQHISPQNGSVNPFFSFFHSNNSRPMVYRQVIINGVPVSTSVSSGEGNQNGMPDFFQEFMNHGQFMRSNRMFIDTGRLIELLEQLRNPNRGVPPSKLSEIERKVFQRNANVAKGEEEKCPICITEFEDGEEIKNLPCNHMFHGNCIDTWLVQNSHCPICKADLLQN